MMTAIKKSTNPWGLSGSSLALVLIIGWIIRYQATFTSDMIPGINGAYYLVQVRAVLESGMLGIPDFPLLFYSEALVTGFLSLFIAQSDAIILVVRWTDTLFPVLLAVPVALFAIDFAKEHRSWAAIAIGIAGLIAVGNSGLWRMAGDFQKNAAALPLSLTFVYFMYRSLNYQRKTDFGLAALFFGLTCLMHIGVAALTLTITGFIAAINLITNPNRKRSLLIAIALGIVLCLVFGLVYLYDPTRIERLLSMVLNPADLFSNSQISRLFGSNQNGIGSPREASALFLGNTLGLIGIGTALVFRKQMAPGTRAVIWASSLTALFFASPFIGGEWSQRLSLMSFVPGLVPLTYLITKKRWGWLIGTLVLGYALFSLSTSHPSTARITEKGYLELEAIAEILPSGDTLIVAEHGIEWWASWVTDSDISNRLELAVESWDDYDHILVLDGSETNFNPGPLQRNQGPAQPGIIDSPLNDRIQARNTSFGLTNPQTETLFQGEVFTLIELVDMPLILQGNGPPDVTGEISFIGDEQLEIDGQIIRLLEDTVISEQRQIISNNELQVGDTILVWGDLGLLTDTITADYIQVGFPGGPPASLGAPPGGPPNRPQQGPTPQPDLEGQLPGNPVSQSIPTETKLGPLKMLTRAGWNAAPLDLAASAENGEFDPQTNPNGVFVYQEPLSDWLTTIVIHHTALPQSEGPFEIQQLHMEKRGYADVGYHFMISPDGTLYEGRDIHIRGAHTGGYNTGTIGIVLIGNFEHIEPSKAQMTTLELLTLYLRDTYGITHLASHRDFQPDETQCPGEYLYALLPDLATRTSLIYSTGGYIPPVWK